MIQRAKKPKSKEGDADIECDAPVEGTASWMRCDREETDDEEGYGTDDGENINDVSQDFPEEEWRSGISSAVNVDKISMI